MDDFEGEYEEAYGSNHQFLLDSNNKTSDAASAEQGSQSNSVSSTVASTGAQNKKKTKLTPEEQQE